MITNFQFRNGLALGLLQETIVIVDEEQDEAFEASAWMLYLGPVLVSFIFGVTSG